MAFDYFEKSLDFYKNKEYTFYDWPQKKKNVMNSHIKEFYDLSQLRHVVLTKWSEWKRARKKNKNYQVSEKEVENLKAACKALVRADNYNGSILRGMLASEIQFNEPESIRVYDAMIERFPMNIKAYINYYNFLKKINRREQLDSVTVKMMKAIEDPIVPTDEWMEAHMIRADALVILKREVEAVDTLENLIQIIPPLPIPGLSYLKKLDQKKMKPEEELDNSNGAINFTYDNEK